MGYSICSADLKSSCHRVVQRLTVSQPYHNVLVTNSSFDSATVALNPEMGSAFLFPSFRFIPRISLGSHGLQHFLKAFVLPEKLNQMHDLALVDSDVQRKRLTRDSSLQGEFDGVRDVNELVVLICGHGGRDMRCGTLGPILQAEFADQLQRRGIKTLTGAPDVILPADEQANQGSARVGLISHIGGHKYAGNVIMYLPPSWSSSHGSLNGMGIWYGRVRPEDVEGIVDQTVFRGTIIENLFRGRIDRNRTVF